MINECNHNLNCFYVNQTLFWFSKYIYVQNWKYKEQQKNEGSNFQTLMYEKNVSWVYI